MPGQQHPEHGLDSKTRVATQLEVPGSPSHRRRSAAPGRPRSTLSHAPGPGPRQERKNVHWAPSVVYNEHKMQPRIQGSASTGQFKKSPAKPPEQPPSSKSSSASNSPNKTDASHIRQPSNFKFMQSRRPISPPLPEHSRAQVHRPAQTIAAANSASRRDPLTRPKSPTKIRKALPMVPDPPRAHPPPAPRPARLPTPDLPEIEEAKFFVPKEKLIVYSRGRSDQRARPVHSKTEDQSK